MSSEMPISPGRPPRSSRFQHIDAMRGIAALAVVYFHIALEVPATGVAISDLERTIFFWTTSILDLGKVAVIVFFAISGYVIPFSLLNNATGSRTSFVIGRFFRLYPAYWVSAIAAAFVLFHLAGRSLSIWTFAINLTMLQGFVRQPDLIGIYWTLQIELIFYALCLGLHLLGWLGKPKAIAGVFGVFLGSAVLMAGVRYASGLKLPVALPMAIAVMYFGMVWRFSHLDRSAAAQRIARLLLAALAISIPLVSVLAYSANYGFHETWYRYTLSYGAAIILFVVLSTVRQPRSAVLAYLGTISYSVYLFGSVVQHATARLLPFLVSGTWPVHLFILVVLLTTIAVASLVYHLIEAPSIALGKRVALRLTHRDTVPAATPFEAPL